MSVKVFKVGDHVVIDKDARVVCSRLQRQAQVNTQSVGCLKDEEANVTVLGIDCASGMAVVSFVNGGDYKRCAFVDVKDIRPLAVKEPSCEGKVVEIDGKKYALKAM